jgi:phosphatidylserine decarboxylase
MMTIHKEGRTLLFWLLVVLSIASYLVYYFLPEERLLFNLILGVSILLYLVILQFFRNPTRVAIISDHHVLAPVDGKVVVIEEVEETEYFKDKRIQISVFMSPINVHVNRAPIKGIVKFVRYHAGLYLVAWHPKSSTENERTTTVIQHKNGTEVLFRQIAGALAKRIVWYVKEGEYVAQTNEMGFIKFGSRVDVFLPVGTKVSVALNQKVKGGKTILAEL